MAPPPPPPGPGYAAPPAPPAPAPPPAPAAPPPADPAGVGNCFARLGNSTKKAVKTSLGIASALLEPGEVVECVVGGKVVDLDGVALLTDRRLLVCNDRQWLPDQVSFPLDAGLSVQGVAEGNSASLTVSRQGTTAVIARISDVTLAQEMAQRIRARSAAAPPPA